MDDMFYPGGFTGATQSLIMELQKSVLQRTRIPPELMPKEPSVPRYGYTYARRGKELWLAVELAPKPKQ